MTASLADGPVGTPYSQTLEADGAISAWAVLSGSLPSGLSLNSATGEISGTPTTAETAFFTVQARDVASATVEKDLSITIYGPLTIVTSSLSLDGMVGRSYNQTLTASGGVLGYTWFVSSGYLPEGLSLSPSGVISGTPTGDSRLYFTVRVTDNGARTATKDLFITIYGSLLISNVSLPSGTVGASYPPTGLVVYGGEQPIRCSGNLSEGLTINSSTCVITGTPKTPGTQSFTVQVWDANSFTITKQFAVTMNGLTCSPAPLRVGGVEYDSLQTICLPGRYHCSPGFGCHRRPHLWTGQISYAQRRV